MKKHFLQNLQVLFYLIVGIAAMQAAPVVGLEQEKNETPILTFGVLTDLHSMTSMISGSESSVRLRDVVKTALNTIKENEKVDLLALDGDYTSEVTIPEANWLRVRELMAEATRNVFPQGAATPVIYCNGNHDYEVANYDKIPKLYNAGDYYNFPMKTDVGVLGEDDCFYETVSNDSSTPVNLLAAFHYVVNDIDFIVLNAGKYFFRSALDYQYSLESVQWVANKLEMILKDDPKKTVFFIAHMPFGDSNSISSPDKGLKNCEATTLLKKTLSRYPGLIYIYGHDHGGDKAYIRTETAQRVTQYDNKGNIYHADPNKEQAAEYCITSFKTGKYLGQTAPFDITTFSEKTTIAITPASGLGMFNLAMDSEHSGKNVYCDAAGYFSGNASKMDLYLYKVQTNNRGVVVADMVTVDEIEDGEYLIVGAKDGMYYALTNESYSSGSNFRLIGGLVSVWEASLTYIDTDLNDDNTAVWNFEKQDDSFSTGFLSVFAGSFCYYGNSIDAGWATAQDPRIAQALMVYVYSDSIVLQIRNYGQTGIVSGVTIRKTPEPYVVRRLGANLRGSYPVITHFFDENKKQENCFLNKATYTNEEGETKELFDLNLGSETLSAFPRRINTSNGGNAMLTFLNSPIEVEEGSVSFDLTCYSTHSVIEIDGIVYYNNMTSVNRKVYIDWNNDGDFFDKNEEYEPTKELILWPGEIPPSHPFLLDKGYTSTFTVPENTPAGIYRMFMVYGQNKTGVWTWDDVFTKNTVYRGNVYEFNIEILEVPENSLRAIDYTKSQGGEFTVIDSTVRARTLKSGDKFKSGRTIVMTVAPEYGYETDVFTVNGKDEKPALDNGVYMIPDCQTDLEVKVEFIESETSVESLSVDKINAYYSSGYLCVEGLHNNERLMIYDITGNCIKTSEYPKVDVSDLLNGCYFVKVFAVDSIYTFKFIKR